MSNYEDLRGAAANEEIILDDQGIPSVMVKVPLVYLDELGIGSAHTPHPAFIINDKVVPYIYVSKYINVIKNNRAYSIPNQDPANCITFLQLLAPPALIVKRYQNTPCIHLWIYGNH